MPNEHLSDRDLLNFAKDELGERKKQKLLEHARSCGYCGDRLLDAVREHAPPPGPIKLSWWNWASIGLFVVLLVVLVVLFVWFLQQAPPEPPVIPPEDRPRVQRPEIDDPGGEQSGVGEPGVEEPGVEEADGESTGVELRAGRVPETGPSPTPTVVPGG